MNWSMTLTSKEQKQEKFPTEMDCTSIDLKVISGRDVKAFNFFQKLYIYAVVSVVDEESKKNQHQKQLDPQQTPVDRDGDGNPEWNHTLHFDLKSIGPFDNLFLKFDLRNEGVVFGNRSIGEVRIPMKDLIEEFHGAVRYLSYQVRNSNGHPNGVLSFSYKLEKMNTSTTTDCCSNHISIEFGVQTQPNNICYPSLDDVLSPLPSITVPSPNCSYSTPESYHMNSNSILPGPYYHPYHPPPLHTSRRCCPEMRL